MSAIARFSSAQTLRWLAFGSVVANVAIVGTGGAVRLTDSGLGCPTWPRCTDSSYVVTPAMGVHGAIEFGNRMLGFAVGLIALAAVVSALLQRPRRPGVVGLAVTVLLGIPAQAVIGGITVLTDLNPWVVGLHFLASMAVLAAAYALWRRVAEPDPTAPPHPPAPAVPANASGSADGSPALRALGWVITTVSAAVLALGTFVTGSGPHAGDEQAHRNGLSPEGITKVHADAVFLLIGLSVALWFALRALNATAAARAAAILIAVELSQGLIGFAQYFTHLPGVLVGAHMIGSCLVWLAALAVLDRTRAGRGRPTGQPATRPAELTRPAGQPSWAAMASASRSAAPSA